MCDKIDQGEEMRKKIASIDPLELSKKHPEWSASVPITPMQKKVVLGVFVLLLVAVVVAPLKTAQILIAFCTIFYIIGKYLYFCLMATAVGKEQHGLFGLCDRPPAGTSNSHAFCRCWLIVFPVIYFMFISTLNFRIR